MTLVWVDGVGMVRYESQPKQKRGNVAGALEAVRARTEALSGAVKAKVEERREHIAESVCGIDLKRAKDHARAAEKAERARARAEALARTTEAKLRCRRAKDDTTQAFTDAIATIDARAREDRARVRQDYAAPRRGPPSETRSRGARRAAETRSEQVDLEAQNVDPSLEKLFRRQARGLITEAKKMSRRGRPTHAWELFGEWVESHPDQVAAYREREAEKKLRKMMEEEIPF